MTTRNVARNFRSIVSNMPDWMINAYEIGQALKEYEKAHVQLVAELGEAGASNFEAKMTHELVPKLMEIGRKMAAEDKGALG